MSDKAYKVVQVVGTSVRSIEDAISCAIKSAHEQNSKLDWFEIVETRGLINADQVAYYQVKLNIGCNF